MSETKIMLLPGDPAPTFRVETSPGKRLFLGDLAGRRILLCFFADLTSANGFGRKLLQSWCDQARLFDGENMLFLGIGYRPEEASDPLLAGLPENMQILWDPQGAIAQQYGMLRVEGGRQQHQFMNVLLDSDLTVLYMIPAQQDEDCTHKMAWAIDALPSLGSYHSLQRHAPVLIIPHVFEPAFCQSLIDGYRKKGGEPSGFMQERDGKTIVVTDPNHKIRSDWIIEDQNIQAAARARIHRRIVPQIAKAFQFQATRIERYIVACYDAEAGGHFRAHRDNTTKGTAHRRFAVTINLNAEEYEGGDLTFPEYGKGTYRAPTGGAVIFSCSLLHQALPVTRGQRFCFLPFLYDDEAAKIRTENDKYLGEGVAKYAG